MYEGQSLNKCRLIAAVIWRGIVLHRIASLDIRTQNDGLYRKAE
jgi:hypothetical protein